MVPWIEHALSTVQSVHGVDGATDQRAASTWNTWNNFVTHHPSGFLASAFASSSASAAPGSAGNLNADADVVPGLPQELQSLAKGGTHLDLLNNNNSQYYGDFMLGNPPQRFTAVFDTGSGLTWIPGAQCESEVCQEHHRFDAHASPGFRDAPDSKVSIHYGTGEIKYVKGTDEMTFCDTRENQGCHGKPDFKLTVKDQPFGMSTSQTTDPFRILPFDGILGLAPSGNPASVLHQIKAMGKLARNVLGFYFSEDTHRVGSVDFGGVEPSHIAANFPLNWHKIQNPRNWEIGLTDIEVNGERLHVCDSYSNGECPAVVDTGSSLLTGPTDGVDKLLAKLPLEQNCKNLDAMPTVNVIIKNADGHEVKYPLTPQEYTLRTIEEVPNSGGPDRLFKGFPFLGGGNDRQFELQSFCESGIGAMDVPGKKWVLGNTFLRRYYSIFDDDKGLVGFVRSIHPDENPSQTPGGVAAEKVATASMSGAFAALPSEMPNASKRCMRPVSVNNFI